MFARHSDAFCNTYLHVTLGHSSLTATVSISVEVDLSEIKNTFTPRVFKRETSEFLAVFDSETCRWPLS